MTQTTIYLLKQTICTEFSFWNLHSIYYLKLWYRWKKSYEYIFQIRKIIFVSTKFQNTIHSRILLKYDSLSYMKIFSKQYICFIYIIYLWTKSKSFQISWIFFVVSLICWAFWQFRLNLTTIFILSIIKLHI